MLEWAMSHPSFKTQLFRFVDVFPATVDDADVLRHLDEYFEGAEAPRFVDVGLGVADHVPFGPSAAASVARRNITRLARQFKLLDKKLQGLFPRFRFKQKVVDEMTPAGQIPANHGDLVNEALAILQKGRGG